MNTPTVTLEISACKQCPFYERHALSVIADLMSKDKERRTGSCKYKANGAPFPLNRMHITNPETTPDNCPLRLASTLVRHK